MLFLWWSKLVISSWAVSSSIPIIGGQRDWVQVVCNGGVASAAVVLYLISAGMGELPLKLSPGRVDPPTLYALACLSALCCSCGDTWASEVGSMLGGTPRLITTLLSQCGNEIHYTKGLRDLVTHFILQSSSMQEIKWCLICAVLRLTTSEDWTLRIASSFGSLSNIWTSSHLQYLP